MVAPVMLMLMMGLGEMTYQDYVQSVLTGAVQKVGRDSTIQGNATAAQSDALDAVVRKAVMALVPSATFVSSRSNFDNYAAIAGEPFTDSKYPNNASGTYDGICNHGESYTDVNSNGHYDTDLSQTGQGGAGDVTQYTMTVTYNRIFPIGTYMGWGRTVTLSATTLLKNQPYATQSMNTGTTTGQCS